MQLSAHCKCKDKHQHLRRPTDPKNLAFHFVLFFFFLLSSIFAAPLTIKLSISNSQNQRHERMIVPLQQLLYERLKKLLQLFTTLWWKTTLHFRPLKRIINYIHAVKHHLTFKLRFPWHIRVSSSWLMYFSFYVSISFPIKSWWEISEHSIL